LWPACHFFVKNSMSSKIGKHWRGVADSSSDVQLGFKCIHKCWKNTSLFLLFFQVTGGSVCFCLCLFATSPSNCVTCLSCSTECHPWNFFDFVTYHHTRAGNLVRIPYISIIFSIFDLDSSNPVGFPRKYEKKLAIIASIGIAANGGIYAAVTVIDTSSVTKQCLSNSYILFSILPIYVSTSSYRVIYIFFVQISQSRMFRMSYYIKSQAVTWIRCRTGL
jgi:hypothetical protein